MTGIIVPKPTQQFLGTGGNRKLPVVLDFKL